MDMDLAAVGSGAGGALSTGIQGIQVEGGEGFVGGVELLPEVSDLGLEIANGGDGVGISTALHARVNAAQLDPHEPQEHGAEAAPEPQGMGSDPSESVEQFFLNCRHTIYDSTRKISVLKPDPTPIPRR